MEDRPFAQSHLEPRAAAGGLSGRYRDEPVAVARDQGIELASELGKRARLEAAIERAHQRWSQEPFEWGKANCLFSLADIIVEACGYDPAAEWRGRFTTQIGCRRATKRFGFAGALESAAIGNEWQAIPPAEALIGDIGLLRATQGICCGVIRFRAGLWLGRSETGFCAVPTKMVKLAWRI
jgi:hypothetical protein